MKCNSSKKMSISKCKVFEKILPEKWCDAHHFIMLRPKGKANISNMLWARTENILEIISSSWKVTPVKRWASANVRIFEKVLRGKWRYVCLSRKSRINMKCIALLLENGGSVQVGVCFMMFPNLSSFIPKRPPSHLGGPGSGRRPVFTLGILSELINYSWNLHLGKSVFFLWLVCKDIMKCDSHTKFHQH